MYSLRASWLRFVLIILICIASTSQVRGQAAVTNGQALGTFVNAPNAVVGDYATLNSQFVFRASVDFGGGGQLALQPGKGPVALFIDPPNPDVPEQGATSPLNANRLFPMVQRGNVWVTYISGSTIGAGAHRFSIVARNNSTAGATNDGVGANPKPAGNLVVVANQQIDLTPVDENFIPDKRPIPGQTGNGLRVEPQNVSTTDDGGGAQVYTWRVRYRNPDRIPPQFFRRTGDEWGDPRVAMRSGLIVALIGPDGLTRWCPMEIDPTAPGQGGLFNATYQTDPVTGRLIRVVGGDIWRTGVYFRYRMMPTQYESRFLGGPTMPDDLPSMPFGGNTGGAIFGRPLANSYAGFSIPKPGQFPSYTTTLNRAGQWKYYYIASNDLRPVTGANPDNGSLNSYPNEPYGSDPSVYTTRSDSDNGGNPNIFDPYKHPFVTPILSDGGWTDDLPANGYPSGISGPAHRSRPTNKSVVRFMVRVTKSDNTPLPAGAVRFWLDGRAFNMNLLPAPNNTDYLSGVLYFFDTTFPPGKEGQHSFYFEAIDGNQKAIWPRRPVDDPQGLSNLIYPPYGPHPNFPNTPTNFYGLTVGRNVMAEPYVNRRPLLENPTVTPASGQDTQPYTYEVTFRDPDNDEPIERIVVIDGVAFNMTAVNNNPTSGGRRYRFVKASLDATPDGKHTYYFRFRDNWANQLAPQRREFGEWISNPPGDDNGIPNAPIEGPIIITNTPPQLRDPAFVPGDPSQTTATLYDFLITYQDAENSAPTSISVHISADGGVTYDSGTPMVRAESGTNYAVGVQFHLLTRIRLAAGSNYRYKFIANDGINEATLIHAGTGSTALANSTAAVLRATDGTRLRYEDPRLTKKWLNSAASTFVWLGTGANARLLTHGVDYTIDSANGQVVLATANQAGETVSASYFYLELVGPTVRANTPPALTQPDPGDPNSNGGTLTPLQGGTTTVFTYSIIYTDADNHAPTVIQVIRDNDRNRRLTLTPDPATPTPINYAGGVRYVGTITGSGIGLGTHTYFFEASDGSNTVRLPLSTDNPSQYTGPSVADIGDLRTPVVSPANGRSTDTYTFTVTYRNASGAAPAYPIEARITPVGSTQTIRLTLSPIDPVGSAQYALGVRFQGQLTAPTDLAPGNYDVAFAYQGLGASTASLTLIVNGPPVLSNPAAVPASISQAGDIRLTVRYLDVNGDPPVRGGAGTLKLFLDGAALTSVQPVSSPLAPSPADFQAGVVYTWTIEARTLSLGTHRFYFTAQDQLEDAVPVPTPPGGTFEVTAAGSPALAEPGGDASNNNGTLTPLAGAQSGQYTFTVRYSHPDNVAPVSVQLVLNPGGAGTQVRNMTQVGTSTDYQGGVLFRYQSQPGELPGGAYTYQFQAADRLATVSLRSGPPHYAGPTINIPPVLSNASVSIDGGTPSTVGALNSLTPGIAGNLTSRFVFRVTYTDQNGTAPAFVRVNVSGTEINLTPRAGDPLNYSAGAVYESAPTTLTPGQKTLFFTASDGTDTARLPIGSAVISGLSVGDVPILVAPNAGGGDDGTLSPRTGRQSTSFTYEIIYRHADNAAPKSVRVIIDGNAHEMIKATVSNDYAAGVLYRFVHQFPSGLNHNYRFEAEDNVNAGHIARYPADGSAIPSPVITGATFSQPVFNPTTGIVGSPVTITGSLINNLGSPTTVNLQTVAPNGGGSSVTISTDASGAFSHTFTPDQTGDWRLRLDWPGVPGQFDPISAEFGFRVSGISIALAANEIDLISIPLIPISIDPAVAFGPTRADGTPVSITALNLIKWAPILGRYLALNTDSNFPAVSGGQAYWIKPSEALVLNPRGRLADQTQPYVISLQPGWNMIGSVYLQDIVWGATKVRFQGQELPLGSASNLVRPIAWSYNKATGSYETVQGSGMLRSGRGYWVRALQAADIVLMPPGTRAAEVSRESQIDRATSLQIMARSGNRADTDNFVALSGATKSRLALMDKPPYPGDYVSVRLLDPETVTLPSATREAVAGQTVIPFEVETDRKNADVTVQFPNYALLGRRYDVTVVDLATGVKRGVGSNGGYTYNSGAEAAPRRFALLVAAQTNSGRLLITELRATSRGATGTSFSFNLTASSNLRAQIVGGNGRVVRDVAQGRAVTRGVNQLLWDGKSAQGVSVPAGVYVLRLTATDESGRQATAAMPITLAR